MPNANRLVLWLIGILSMIAVLWYGYWFSQNFEERTEEVRTDISPEARKNRFLAAELFIKRLEREVESRAGHDIFSVKPAKNDTIVLGGPSSMFLDRNHEQLHEWVKAGGNLILVPEGKYLSEEEDEEGETNPLLAELGVELLIIDDWDELSDSCEADAESCEEETGDKPSTEENDDDGRVTVTFRASHPGEFEARFLADRYLFDGSDLAETIVGEAATPNLLRYSLESGTVTVLSDINLFTNTAIGENDHAYLLHQLVGESGKVWIFYSADMPSLLTLLWQRAPYLSAIAVFLLLMAGWRMLHKSGPQLRPQFDARRNLLEHLDASAEYSWRIDKARVLFANNRHAVEQAWRRRHPQLGSMEQNERSEWIGEKVGITARAVERTLYGDITSEQDFIRASAVLQKLAIHVNYVMTSASA